MRQTFLLTAIAIVSLSMAADAHFVLVYPAASMLQNQLGDPQKIGPCGGVSANPGRVTPANPGVPSGAVTELKGGSTLNLMVQETIFHPGHYRVALARAASQLPKDPVVTTHETPNGVRSQSAEIMNPAAPPVLADGLFPHTERPTQNFTAQVPIPNIECKNCLIQVIQFMAEHPGVQIDGGFSYHHCAVVNITPDPDKPRDTRWQ